MKDCFRFLAALLVLSFAGAAGADPCLVVYPTGPCNYHYDMSEYYTAGSGDPYYDAAYDRGGEVLLEVGSNEIDLSIYQAPGLMGFEPSTDGNDGYFFLDTEFELVIDGFSDIPTTYPNILVVFDKYVPYGCVPDIMVNGMPIVGNTFSAGDLAVTTPTEDGNNYSDTMVILVSWHGCYGLHAWAFSDEDYSGTHDGGECFTAFSHDSTIPTEASTWGSIKSQYDK
ncbi:MAG TPA: hypothetical protein ENO08_03205 [Candidatus Eisenbacteria bacterium]|uniref:PEP-CTERM sorting domain-containing protein n=1 Tax=Eiseniibacteriota bacterium TaxID=2212470 RepID=A0A7V2AUF7_UNCEI|nr:hypothetical protein [Candidatus Eisenbacteria bacterium]